MATSSSSYNPSDATLTVPRVVITDCNLAGEGAEQAELGEHVQLVTASCATADDIVAAGAGAAGLLVQWAPVTSSVIESLPDLRVVVRYGIGVDNVDQVAAAGRGVLVRNVPDYCIDEVAEHTVAMILARARRLVDYNSEVKAGNFSVRETPPPLRAASDPVGLVGFGRIARAVAARLVALGHPVLAWDPLTSVDTAGVTQVADLQGLAASANHLSLHVPLTDETRGLASAELLAALGPKGHLVNTARGGLVDEQALLDALDRGTIGWASLDVFSSEPPTGLAVQLASHPRVLTTPHAAYLSTESPIRLRTRAAQIMLESLREIGAVGT